MAEDLQGQLRPTESLTSRHRHSWQISHFNGGQNASQRGIPGSECCDNTKPATDPDECGKCATAKSSQPSNGQGKEGQEQQREDSNQGPGDPKRGNQHQTGEDCPPQEEDTNSLTESICLDKRRSNPSWGQNYNSESQPEAGIGAEGGCAKGIACPELLYARNELDETTIE